MSWPTTTTSSARPSAVRLDRAVTTGADASATTAPTVAAGIVDDAVNGPFTPAGSTHVARADRVERLERLRIELLHQARHHEQQREHDGAENDDDHEANERGTADRAAVSRIIDAAEPRLRGRPARGPFDGIVVADLRRPPATRSKSSRPTPGRSSCTSRSTSPSRNDALLVVHGTGQHAAQQHGRDARILDWPRGGPWSAAPGTPDTDSVRSRLRPRAPLRRDVDGDHRADRRIRAHHLHRQVVEHAAVDEQVAVERDRREHSREWRRSPGSPGRRSPRRWTSSARRRQVRRHAVERQPQILDVPAARSWRRCSC